MYRQKISALSYALALSALLFTSGCPDPTVGQTPMGAGGGGGGPAAGGQPGQGGPGGGGGMGGGQPQGGPGGRPDVHFEVEDGNAVTVSGTISYEGEQTGQITLDFLRREGDKPPELLHSEKLDALGDWSVRVPKSTGSLSIVGFIDTTGQGPFSDDAAGMPEGTVTVEDADVPGVVIVLADDANLGELEPRSKTEDGGAPPMPGGAGGSPAKAKGPPPPDGPEPSTAQQSPAEQAAPEGGPPH